MIFMGAFVPSVYSIYKTSYGRLAVKLLQDEHKTPYFEDESTLENNIIGQVQRLNTYHLWNVSFNAAMRNEYTGVLNDAI